ncbi:MAG: TetR/AcrR family transcriptional regulator, partial [Clostridia bacterium]
MKNLTKSHILSCFNNLMKEYPFEKITVEMIIKNSEVSKSTFYRHYIDKFDVMNYSYVNFV